MDGGQALLGFILFIAVVVIVFLVTREFWCWYWKINEGIDLQRQILAALASSASPGGSGRSGVASVGSTAAEDYAAGRITKQEYEGRVARRA